MQRGKRLNNNHQLPFEYALIDFILSLYQQTRHPRELLRSFAVTLFLFPARVRKFMNKKYIIIIKRKG